MKPRERSHTLLGVTRAKGKMFEYSVPVEEHIAIPRNPSVLFPLSIGLLGDVAADLNRRNANAEILKENIRELRFSALFFDSYIQSRLNQEIDQYLLLLGSAAYYLCDMAGSSHVLLSRVRQHDVALQTQGVGTLLHWILKSNYTENPELTHDDCSRELETLKNSARSFFVGQGPDTDLERHIATLREKIYLIGSPRELLLTDIICAVLRIKVSNSSRKLLPQFSGLDVEAWENALQKDSFIRELWPSQRLLGSDGVYRGVSAIIQMPTSAGKSKSIEITIRSAFLSGRTKTCVVVAPFRALCHEITETLRKAFIDEEITVNELTDVFQADFDADDLIGQQSCQVLAVTPEKLVYVLRQSPELANEIGLLILDEGHQFDSGVRGVTYELLITSLKSLLPENVQTVLISAVISNAEVIAGWLMPAGKVIKDASLTPTFRTIGFSTWTTNQGRIQYVRSDNITQEEFFVPRVIESQRLNRRLRQRTDKFFPVRDDGSSVAAHLGLKLAQNGGVAIFCGVKSTAANLTEKIVTAFETGYNIAPPSQFSVAEELTKFAFLYQENFGPDSVECRGARYGILNHHASIPHGIRTCTEYAIREGHARFIVCTSTLAQGVNLPIRYLIFTNIYMAGERIKVRDFHNLIGRAGRSGLQTEGTILFADPEVYDKRNHRTDKWRFRTVRELFDPAGSEPCASSLLKIFDPISSADNKFTLQNHNILETIHNYYNNEASLETLISAIAREVGESGFDEKTVRKQLKLKLKIAGAIEGHLISALDEIAVEERETHSMNLAQRTLAYHLASAEQKDQLTKMFVLISRNIDAKVTSETKKAVYSRTLLGVAELLEIDAWIEEHLDPIILSSGADDDMFAQLTPIVEKFIEGTNLKKVVPETLRPQIMQTWISGASYAEIKDFIVTAGGKIQAGSKTRKLTIQHVVEICEGELAFDGMLILGAIAEVLESHAELQDTTIPDSVRMLQKRIKYGLPNELSVRVFELGFSERVIAQRIAAVLEAAPINNRYMLIEAVRNHQTQIEAELALFPAYFTEVLHRHV